MNWRVGAPSGGGHHGSSRIRVIPGSLPIPPHIKDMPQTQAFGAASKRVHGLRSGASTGPAGEEDAGRSDYRGAWEADAPAATLEPSRPNSGTEPPRKSPRPSTGRHSSSEGPPHRHLI